MDLTVFLSLLSPFASLQPLHQALPLGLVQLEEKNVPVTQKGFWELTPSSKRLKPEASITDVYRPLVCLPNITPSPSARLSVFFSTLFFGFARTSPSSPVAPPPNSPPSWKTPPCCSVILFPLNVWPDLSQVYVQSHLFPA